MVAAALPAPSGKRDRTENLRPFQKGVSGNPAGRPKGSAGLAAYIKKQTKDGKVLAEQVLGILLFEKDAKVRLDAAAWLADRAFGRAVQSHEITGAEGGEIVFTLRIGERGGDEES